MIQEQDVPAASQVSFRLALAQEARASLEAVREAQEAARLRARRQTRRARLLFVVSMAGLALAAVAMGPRVTRIPRQKQNPSATNETRARAPR